MYEEPFTVERAKSALAAIISALESPQQAGMLVADPEYYGHLPYALLSRIQEPDPFKILF